jgi:hypothetical protein
MKTALKMAIVAAAAAVLTLAAGPQSGPDPQWGIHDPNRPLPPVFDPGPGPAQPVPAPPGAVMLFDGTDLSKWSDAKGGAAKWKVENGYFEVSGGGDLLSKEKFGDAQYHVEWSSPAEVKGDSQNRGNSGFLMMSRYEIQVLDSWNNVTYADGQAGSIYGQWPPLVNPARKPGEWNVYDIAFEAPVFEDGQLKKPAYVTVFYNGVLVHNRKELVGRMAHRVVGTYAPHAPEEPLMLQDHGSPVRYRNIWVRRIGGYDQAAR